MRKTNSAYWGRMVLAFAATLVVAGPGVVIAGPGTPSYTTPRFAVLVGPSSVPAGSTADYSLKVTFTDGSTALMKGPQATFDAVKGSFSGSLYTAPSTTGRDGLQGTFAQNGVSATGQKIITVQ